MNVQQRIIKGIGELLYSHNYVVLPGFGGFVLKESPSHLSASGGLLFPPSKTVGFNAQLKQNDGVLSFWLEKSIGCTSSEALSHLQEFAQFCSGLLQIKRRFNLEGIGFFYLDFENNLCFEPFQDSNFLRDSFGLGSISLQALEVEHKDVTQSPVFEDRKELGLLPSPVAQKARYRKLIYPSLLGLILVTLLGLLVNNIKITGALESSVLETSGKHHYRSLNYDPLQLNNSPSIANTYVADANGIASLRLNNQKTIAVRINDAVFAGAAHNETGDALNKGNFEVVLGCFSIKENASKMVRKLSKKHIKAIISGQNAKGLFVVSKGSYQHREEAMAALQDLKDRFPNAWIKQND